jgi:hypothetical protein
MQEVIKNYLQKMIAIWLEELGLNREAIWLNQSGIIAALLLA